MIIRLIESNGSVKATIPLADIKHVETRTLNYFGEKTHNLYLFIGEGKEECFMLMTYLCPIEMEKAERMLQDLIRQAPLDGPTDEETVFELYPDAAPATDITRH
jgi:hypothetical protein